MQQLQPSFINSIVNIYIDYANLLAKVGSKIDITNEYADIYSGVGIGIGPAIVYIIFCQVHLLRYNDIVKPFIFTVRIVLVKIL
ncbi:MAG: hypothetical protein H0T62_14380 [Parachlamydiaceae bacterium]|nr:hypothetical protein [Parachlamydiaceae bacterium]